MGAKTRGAWNLHQVLPSGLNFFVMSASIGGVLGAVSVAAYSAANSYLEGLARYRNAMGEKATALCLGPAEDDGRLAEDQDLLRRFLMGGKYVALSEQEILAQVDYACDPSAEFANKRSHVVSGFEIPAKIVAKGFEMPEAMRQPLWRYMHQVKASAVDNSGSSPAVAEQSKSLETMLDTVDSMEEGGRLIALALAERVAKTVSLTEEMDLNRPMATYGVDSLTAVDLRNWFAKTTGVDVAVFEILGDASCAKIGVLVASKYRDKKIKGKEV